MSHPAMRGTRKKMAKATALTTNSRITAATSRRTMNVSTVFGCRQGSRITAPPTSRSAGAFTYLCIGELVRVSTSCWCRGGVAVLPERGVDEHVAQVARPVEQALGPAHGEHEPALHDRLVDLTPDDLGSRGDLGPDRPGRHGERVRAPGCLGEGPDLPAGTSPTSSTRRSTTTTTRPSARPTSSRPRHQCRGR